MSLSKGLVKKKSEKKSKPKSKKKHRIRSMHITPADNGGFVATHDYHPEDGDEGGGAMQSPESTTHALAGPNELLQHVADNMGGQMPQQGTGPVQGAPQGM